MLFWILILDEAFVELFFELYFIAFVIYAEYACPLSLSPPPPSPLCVWHMLDIFTRTGLCFDAAPCLCFLLGSGF